MSKDALISAVEQQYTKKNLPTFRVGDSLEVVSALSMWGGKKEPSISSVPVSHIKVRVRQRPLRCIALPMARVWNVFSSFTALCEYRGWFEEAMSAEPNCTT